MPNVVRPWPLPRQVSFVLGAAVIVVAFSPAAWALIERLMPLSTIIADADFIFVAKVEKIAPDKPGMILTVAEDLKEKASFRRLAVNLTGDADAVKEKQLEKLLERIAPDLPIVVFVNQPNKNYMLLAYTNGTWFQIVGQADGNDIRWSYTHFEPFLRRSFSGTTAEMRQIVADAVVGKQKPPAIRPKEPPGIGPVVEKSSEGVADKKVDPKTEKQ